MNAAIMLPSPPAEMETLTSSKRKRSDIEVDEIRSNDIQTLYNVSTNTDVSFELILAILRVHLPLCWLSPTAFDDDMPIGSVLQGSIRNTSAWNYHILIVRQCPNGGLYAIERVDEDTYVTQPLRSFVTQYHVRNAAVGIPTPISLQMLLHDVPIETEGNISTRLTTPKSIHDSGIKVAKNRRGAAARLSLLSTDSVNNPVISVLDVNNPIVASPSQTVPSFIESPLQNPAVFLPSKLHLESTEPTQLESQHSDPMRDIAVSEGLETDMLSPAYMRQRYLENLYLVKTSLAFYAKGPLSRARARARAENASMGLTQLASFYRDSVLPTRKMDLKYRESLRVEIVSMSSSPGKYSLNLKKSSRKTKLGKDGLWPAEKEYIRKWWQDRSTNNSRTNHDPMADLSNTLVSIRMRETQMQIIIMLEAMSIESKIKNLEAPVQPVPEHPDIKAESIEKDLLKETEQANTTKRRDLETDMYSLADNLCIYHMIGLDNLTMSDKDEKDKSDSSESKDELRNFCTDVLIPFYYSKLPLICKKLCTTLAGPDVLAITQKASKPRATAAEASRPGAELRRRAPSLFGKSLDKLISQDIHRSSSPPSLSRSSTMPAQLKRESSEVSMTSAPPRALSRQKSMSFNTREVDLIGDANMTASKKRKINLLDCQKQQMAAAISALRKPDRSTVSKLYVDEAEQRLSAASKSVGRATVVTATPHTHRKKNMNDHEYALPPMPVPSLYQKTADTTAVPSSTSKPRGLFAANLNAVRSSENKKAVLAAISVHDTPSKPRVRILNPFSASRSTNKLSTPSASADDCAMLTATPSKQHDMTDYFATSAKQTLYRTTTKENEASFDFEFPVSAAASATMDRAMGLRSAGAQADDHEGTRQDTNVGSSNDASIYDALGWDD